MPCCDEAVSAPSLDGLQLIVCVNFEGVVLEVWEDEYAVAPLILPEDQLLPLLLTLLLFAIKHIYYKRKLQQKLILKGKSLLLHWKSAKMM